MSQASQLQAVGVGPKSSLQDVAMSILFKIQIFETFFLNRYDLL